MAWNEPGGNKDPWSRKPSKGNSELENFDNISKILGILPGAIAKKKPSKTATEPRANKILSIILSHFL